LKNQWERRPNDAWGKKKILAAIGEKKRGAAIINFIYGGNLGGFENMARLGTHTKAGGGRRFTGRSSVN